MGKVTDMVARTFNVLHHKIEELEEENAKLKARTVGAFGYVGICARCKQERGLQVRGAKEGDMLCIPCAGKMIQHMAPEHDLFHEREEKLVKANFVPCSECRQKPGTVKCVETGDLFCTDCTIAMLRSQVLHLQNRRDNLKQACSDRGVALEKAEKENTALRSRLKRVQEYAREHFAKEHGEVLGLFALLDSPVFAFPTEEDPILKANRGPLRCPRCRQETLSPDTGACSNCDFKMDFWPPNAPEEKPS